MVNGGSHLRTLLSACVMEEVTGKEEEKKEAPVAPYVANKAELDGVYKSVMLSSIKSGYSQQVNTNSISYFVIDYNDSTACYRDVNTDLILGLTQAAHAERSSGRKTC
jgi:hypothetical protein